MNVQKVNYQKELDKILDPYPERRKSAFASAAQLLCSVQQLCAGISVGIF